MKSSYTEVMNVKAPAGSRTKNLDLAENTDSSRILSIREVPKSKSETKSRILIDEEFVGTLHRALIAVLKMNEPNEMAKSYSDETKRRDHPRAYRRADLAASDESERIVAAWVGPRHAPDLSRFLFMSSAG